MDILQYVEQKRKEMIGTDPVVVIHVDMDKTLTLDTCWTEDECMVAIPNMDMVEVVNELAEGNNVVIIYTARIDSLIPATMRWLRKHCVRHDGISNEKRATTIYIDDKAFNPFLPGHSIKDNGNAPDNKN